MKTSTITLDDWTARWLLRHAAERGMRVSHAVSEMLHERMREAHAWDAAMWRLQVQRPFEFADGSPPSREDLHDRAGFR